MLKHQTMASLTIINTPVTKIDKSYDFEASISDIDGLEFLICRTREIAMERKSSFKCKKQYQKCIIQLAHYCRDLASLRETLLTLKARVNKGIQSTVTTNASSNVEEIKQRILASIGSVCKIVKFDPSRL